MPNQVLGIIPLLESLKTGIDPEEIRIVI